MAITQGSSTNSPDKSQKNKRRFVASAWLIMALLTGAAALALWMFSSAPVFEEEKETISFNQMLKELIELHGDDFWKE